MKDIYFESDYGKLYEEMEKGKKISYNFENEYGSISNLFIKREIPIKLDDNTTYFDLTTPYGYGGPIINSLNEGKKKELLKSYYLDFKNKCKEMNVVSEFIRFHPLFNNHEDFTSIYETTYMRKTVGTNLKDFDDPFQAEFSKSARKNIRRSLREGVTYEIIEEPNTIEEFLNIYYSTMDRNNANEYYYFDEKYFNSTLKYFKKNLLLIKVIINGETIAMGLYFKYNNILHTHLSGTLTEYLHLSPAYILRYALTKWGIENGYNLIHHGGATTNDVNDSLYKFKKRFGKNTEFDFYTGQKIWNNNIYDKICKHIKVSENEKFFPKYRANILN